jgi:hypothetical protein
MVLAYDPLPSGEVMLRQYVGKNRQFASLLEVIKPYAQAATPAEHNEVLRLAHEFAAGLLAECGPKDRPRKLFRLLTAAAALLDEAKVVFETPAK